MNDETIVTTSEDSDHEKKYRIFVNTIENTVMSETLSYEMVVDLAFPSPTPGTVYSVDFEKAEEPKEGELFAGQSLEIKEGTEFVVSDTGRS